MPKDSIISRIENNIVQSEPMSSATVATTLPNEPVGRTPATTPLTTDKSIVGVMREQFYRIFGEMYSKIKEGGNNTTTKKRYDVIVQNLQMCRTAGIKKPQI